MTHSRKFKTNTDVYFRKTVVPKGSVVYITGEDSEGNFAATHKGDVGIIHEEFRVNFTELLPSKVDFNRSATVVLAELVAERSGQPYDFYLEREEIYFIVEAADDRMSLLKKWVAFNRQVCDKLQDNRPTAK